MTMTRITRLTLAGVIAACAPVSAMAQGALDPAQNWAAIAACAEQRGRDARHACIDQVLRTAGLLDGRREIAEQREDFGQNDAARETVRAAARDDAIARQAATGATDQITANDGTRNAAVPPAPPPRIDALDTMISEARLDPRGRLRVLTAEGAIWQQLDRQINRRIPEPGTRIEISRTTMGGFRCNIDGGASFRCERLN